VASYEETLVNITLDADASIVVDTSPPYTGNAAPVGGSAAAGFQYRFVQVTDPHTCGLFDGTETGDIPVGVLQNKPQVLGMAATVAVAGISLVEAGGAVTAGAVVEADATGRAVVLADGPGVGIAIHDGAAGELIPVLLRLTTAAVPA
jgi:hypothetical protein